MSGPLHLLQGRIDVGCAQPCDGERLRQWTAFEDVLAIKVHLNGEFARMVMLNLAENPAHKQADFSELNPYRTILD